MEFIKTKIYGGEVNVIFTGSHYYFFSGWYGLFAVAQRAEENGCTFNIYISEDHPYGGDYKEFEALAKRVITKHEQRYITKDLKFIRHFADVYRWRVELLPTIID